MTVLISTTTTTATATSDVITDSSSSECRCRRRRRCAVTTAMFGPGKAHDIDEIQYQIETTECEHQLQIGYRLLCLGAMEVQYQYTDGLADHEYCDHDQCRDGNERRYNLPLQYLLSIVTGGSWRRRLGRGGSIVLW